MALADVCKTDAPNGGYFLNFKTPHQSKQHELDECFDEDFTVPTAKERNLRYGKSNHQNVVQHNNIVYYITIKTIWGCFPAMESAVEL
ncbi:unnamed protein product [Clavelina lepadiformis]|uniref:Uncharacterized protein n=1 Tax=Clavelina lepadiformis TaxID=159417 RepID=A0ABP0GVS5_CLALP